MCVYVYVCVHVYVNDSVVVFVVFFFYVCVCVEGYVKEEAGAFRSDLLKIASADIRDFDNNVRYDLKRVEGPTVGVNMNHL